MRYFFNEAGASALCDEIGQDLPDPEAARIVAGQFAGELLHDQPSLIWDGQEFRVEVTDEEGVLLFAVVIAGVDAPAARSG